MFAFHAMDALPPTSNYATLGVVEDASTPAGITPVLIFADGATELVADFIWHVPSNYADSGITLNWKGGTDNTSVGTLSLVAKVVKVADADVLTADQGRDDATGTSVAMTDTPPATPQDKLNYSADSTALTHAQIGSPSPGDVCFVRVYRDTSVDTNTGSLQLAELVGKET